MRIIVTGSIAYDYIMVFPGHFKDHILPEKMHILSVSFLVESMKKQRGGTAANIAYNLALLGERPEVVATVGEDFADYRSWLERHGVDTAGIAVVPSEFTSSCFINTDLQDNQITAFYPGAMSHAHSLRFDGRGLGANDLVIISPNDPGAMSNYAAECTRLGIPYLYDPSMQAPRMTADELRAGFAGARILTGNDYEFGMMAEKLGITEPDLRALVPVYSRHQRRGRCVDLHRRRGACHPQRPRQHRRRSHRRGRCLPRRPGQRLGQRPAVAERRPRGRGQRGLRYRAGRDAAAQLHRRRLPGPLPRKLRQRPRCRGALERAGCRHSLTVRLAACAALVYNFQGALFTDG